MNFSFSALLIGGGVNLAIVWMLSQYSSRLALYYALMMLLVLLLLYWRSIATSFSLVSSLLKATTKPNSVANNTPLNKR
jgi:multisubunit Na+/H+ antiporter MnhE subunit